MRGEEFIALADRFHSENFRARPPNYCSASGSASKTWPAWRNALTTSPLSSKSPSSSTS